MTKTTETVLVKHQLVNQMIRKFFYLWSTVLDTEVTHPYKSKEFEKYFIKLLQLNLNTNPNIEP
jgi:hypothetical protein